MSEEMLDHRDLSNVALTHPVIDNQTVLCTTGQVKLEHTGADKKGPRRLVVPLTLDEPARATDGRELTPGFSTTVGFLVDASGGWTLGRANEQLSRFQVAVLKLDKPTDFNFADLSPYQGKQVKVQFVQQRNDASRQDVRAWLKA